MSPDEPTDLFPPLAAAHDAAPATRADIPATPTDVSPRSADLIVPLAERLRPEVLEDVVGQRHLLAPGRPLAVAFSSGKLHSMILWGPPGSGKTTLAQLMARRFNAEFIAISAVLSGVKDIREAVARAEELRARSGRATILFVDEVHRFNKAQQDAFLPHVERGLLTFIGATTENPSFEVIGALLSRSTVYVLEPLSADDLGRLLARAVQALPWRFTVDAPAREAVVAYADGDARRLVNLVEQLGTAAQDAKRDAIDVAFIESALARNLRRFDKGGEAFYDQISALHKSVRGSDPDAALYWMCRMLDGGADPRYVGRRMVRMASEDIGLADPRALGIALDAVAAWERLGSPEGELALAECVLYLACAPKSNAVYTAYGAARSFIAGDASRPVPLRLRNAPTRLMSELGYGKGYRYAHDEPGAHAAGERYFPDGMPEQRFYQPTERGHEARICERLDALRAGDRSAQGETGGEPST